MTHPANAGLPGYLAGTWQADPAHSEIAFSIRLLAGRTRGRFTGHDITVVTGEDPLDSSVTATIDLASVDTGNERRDNHLRSDEYLDVERYPTMSYRSIGVRRAGEGRAGEGWVVDGELTLHGVIRPVPLAVTVDGFHPDPLGGEQADFTATAQVNRRDFGIDMAVPMDRSGVLISDRIPISLKIRAVRQKHRSEETSHADNSGKQQGDVPASS